MQDNEQLKKSGKTFLFAKISIILPNFRCVVNRNFSSSIDTCAAGNNMSRNRRIKHFLRKISVLPKRNATTKIHYCLLTSKTPHTFACGVLFSFFP